MADPGVHFDKCRGYIASQISHAKKRDKRSVESGPAVTISRETGAGAVTLGDRLTNYLNERAKRNESPWTVFDKNLVKRVLEDHDLPERLERFMPEDKPNVLENIFGDMLGVHPPDWKLVQHTQETIYRLAKMGNCILVGRGANIITRDLSNVFHVRLVGSPEVRAVHCMDYYGMTDDEAREFIKKQDRARRRYLFAYYDTEIDDPTNYHIVINVDMFSAGELVRLICDNIAGMSE